jgi:hypothetical protein
MGVRRGGQGGGSCPPPLAGQGRPKIVCFFIFFGGKIVSFLLFFRQKVGSCPSPPGKCLPSPGKKSAVAHENYCNQSSNAYNHLILMDFSRIMDCFLAEGIEVIFRLALSLLLIGKQELLVQDIEGVIRVRKRAYICLFLQNETERKLFGFGGSVLGSNHFLTPPPPHPPHK